MKTKVKTALEELEELIKQNKRTKPEPTPASQRWFKSIYKQL